MSFLQEKVPQSLFSCVDVECPGITKFVNDWYCSLNILEVKMSTWHLKIYFRASLNQCLHPSRLIIPTKKPVSTRDHLVF